MTPIEKDPRVEWMKCAADVSYFTVRYVRIYNATARAWVRFDLWPAQHAVLGGMAQDRLLVILKARQLGLSWLCLSYALWMALFDAPATILLFSLREIEAVDLLNRMKGIYGRLPGWMQARRAVQNAARLWELSNGSRVLAFSTRGGRSYTGSLALVDEADYVPDLATFLNAVKPTVDAGGKLFLVSTSDKQRPVSPFKNLFRASQRQGLGSREGGVGAEDAGDYKAIFLPWHAHPARDQAWHDRTQAEMFAQRGTHDDFYAEYPATPQEALAPEQLDRRIPYDWLQGVTEFLPACEDAQVPALAGLTVYAPPLSGRGYVIGADPAEGIPHRDASAACVLDAATWAEVATLAGPLEPGVFAQALAQLAGYYNQADLLVERNNHGHAVIRTLQEQGEVRLLEGYDGKPGWLSNIKGKPLLYDAAAEAVRSGTCRIRSGETVAQLASIEASTLAAPAGLHDDRADAFALALAALAYGRGRGAASTVAAARDPLLEMDHAKGW
jgi:hypothetical protein